MTTRRSGQQPVRELLHTLETYRRGKASAAATTTTTEHESHGMERDDGKIRMLLPCPARVKRGSNHRKRVRRGREQGLLDSLFAHQPDPPVHLSPQLGSGAPALRRWRARFPWTIGRIYAWCRGGRAAMAGIWLRPHCCRATHACMYVYVRWGRLVCLGRRFWWADA